MFVRDEGEHVVLGSGLPEAWTGQPGKAMAFGPAPTQFGPIDLRLETGATGREDVTVSWDARWHHAPASVELRLPGFPARRLEAASGTITVAKEPSVAEERSA